MIERQYQEFLAIVRRVLGETEMNKDRELLEAAAKAAGIEYEWKQEGYVGGETGIVPEGWRRCWNPLTDDGDALRLAVKLGIVVNVWNPAKKTYAGEAEGAGATEPHNNDPYAATRRCITRAAAEIGKGMNDAD